MDLFREEAKTLYDETHNVVGKGGVALHMDPIFPEGAFKVQWLGGDTSTRRPSFNYSEGKVTNVEEYNFGSVRICRKDQVIRDHTRPSRK